MEESVKCKLKNKAEVSQPCFLICFAALEIFKVKIHRAVEKDFRFLALKSNRRHYLHANINLNLHEI